MNTKYMNQLLEAYFQLWLWENWIKRISIDV